MREIGKRHSAWLEVFASVGLVLSAYLVWLHHEVHTNPVQASWCSLSDTVDCAAAELADRAVFLWMPRAAWGVMGYTFLLAMVLPRRFGKGRSLGAPVFLLCSLMVSAAIESLVASVQARTLCVVCWATHGVSLVCFAVSSHEIQTRGNTFVAAFREDIGRLVHMPTRVFAVLLGVIFVATAGNLLYPKYWVFTMPRPFGPADLPTGVDEQGHPWIGARDPRLTIEELSDYECPICARSHAAVRAAVRQWPQDIRLVHRAFPLDIACNRLLGAPFHDNACLAAEVACCAARQDRFWLMNDWLYASWSNHEPDRLERLVESAGLDTAALRHCLASSVCKEAIAGDVEAGIALGLESTPAYRVGGQLVHGRLDTTHISRILAESPPR